MAEKEVIEKVQTYKRTWCDYLTDCEHFPHIEIRSYECSQCKFFAGFGKETIESFEPGSYKRYFAVTNGEVLCKHKLKN